MACLSAKEFSGPVDRPVMIMQLFCLVDKCLASDDATQFFVVSTSIDEAVESFKTNIAAPHSKYNLEAQPARVETNLVLELRSQSGQWDKIGYLNFRVNDDIPKKLPVYVTALRPNMVFN